MMENNIKKNTYIYIYIYGWVFLLYSRNWHNIVNQLYLNNLKNDKNEDCAHIWKSKHKIKLRDKKQETTEFTHPRYKQGDTVNVWIDRIQG